jgi:tRNA(Ile)-lysidine synthase
LPLSEARVEVGLAAGKGIEAAARDARYAARKARQR